MFYDKIYRGTSENRPIVTDDAKKYQGKLDRDLANIMRKLPTGNEVNRETAFWLDDVAPSFAYMTAYMNVAGGIKVKIADDEKAEKLVRKFNDNINVKGETIEDYIVSDWFDNLIHKYSLWRVATDVYETDGTKREMIDFQRISPKTISKVEIDSTSGWRMFTQSTRQSHQYETPEDFLNKENQKSHKWVTLRFLDDPTICIHSSHFFKAPMKAIVPWIVLKYWIVAFIRKFAEKMWAPYLIGLVGDENNMPQGDQMDFALRRVSSALLKLKNFSAASFPGYTNVKLAEVKGKGSAYIEFIDKINEAIMYGLCGSIAVRKANSVYQGSKTADEANISFTKGIRGRIKKNLKRLYVNNVVPWIEPEQIKIVMPELRASDINSLVNGLDVAVTSGVFKDTDEVRRAFSQVFPFLMDTTLTDEEKKKLEEQRIEMRAPSKANQDAQSRGDQISGGIKSSAKIQNKG